MSKEDQMDRIEDLLAQLIRNVASVRNEMTDFRIEMNRFREETNNQLEKIEKYQQDLAGQVALLNNRLDYQLSRIAKTEEEIHLIKGN